MYIECIVSFSCKVICFVYCLAAGIVIKIMDIDMYA